MKIVNDVLCSIDVADIDATGTLRIPDGVRAVGRYVGNKLDGLRTLVVADSVVEIGNMAFAYNNNLGAVYLGNGVADLHEYAFCLCPAIHTVQIPSSWRRISHAFQLFSGDNIRTVIRAGQSYCIIQDMDFFFVVHNERAIGGMRLMNLERVVFDETGLNGKKYVGMCRQNNMYINNTWDKVFVAVRHDEYMRELDRNLEHYGVDDGRKIWDVNIRRTIHNAMEMTLNKIGRFSIPVRRQMTHHINHVRQTSDAIHAMVAKYPSVDASLKELAGCDMDTLNRILAPDAGPRAHASATRHLRRRPHDADDMFRLWIDGYRYAGAFPYEWISGVGPEKRGALSLQLHNMFTDAARQMYSPIGTESIVLVGHKVTRRLASALGELTGCDIEISFMSQGHFGKSYRIITDGVTEHVWKTYHCDNNHVFMRDWAADTEIQNSFLANNYKYSGPFRFRHAGVAGISPQRGEQYMIYPMVRGTAHHAPHDPYAPVKRFEIFDFESNDNCYDHTIVDMGGIQINDIYWNWPHAQKIINTILYHSKDAVHQLPSRYSPDEIQAVIEFMNRKLISLTSLIKGRIEYLNKMTR